MTDVLAGMPSAKARCLPARSIYLFDIFFKEFLYCITTKYLSLELVILFFGSWEMIYPKRKTIHLHKEIYQGPMIGMATLCFYQQYDIIKAGFGEKILNQLTAFPEKLDIDIMAFCLMPDHLHLILEIKDSSQNFLDIISYLKRKMVFDLRGLISMKKLWQDRFMDRIIRDERELKKMVRYIFENPVRKKFVNDFRLWPFSGGYYFDVWK